MSEATEALRASLAEQKKQTEALIKNSKKVQADLRSALTSAEAALKEGESVRKKMDEAYPGRKTEAISDADKTKVGKLLAIMEKEFGQKPNASEASKIIEDDGVLQALLSEEKGVSELSKHAPVPSNKKGHIAL